MAEVHYDIRDIMRMLPHRYPFLLVDRIVDFDQENGNSIVALKNVTFNEPFFPGHFPGVPTMPGVLMIEALAQTSGLLAMLKTGIKPDSSMIMYFAAIDECRFKRPVVPGDQLHLHATVDRHKRDIWRFAVKATVEGELAVEARLMCAIRPQDS